MRNKVVSVIVFLMICVLFSGCTSAAGISGGNTSGIGEESDRRELSVSGEESEKTEDAETTEPDLPITDAADARETCFREILYKYKEAQAGGYSMERVEEMGLQTELVQHGWPYAGTADEVRYLYYDVDADGSDELIITYYNDIVDIYGYDGEKARLAFSTPYRGIAELYPDGMLVLAFSISAGDSTTTWYQYNTSLGDFFSVYQGIFEEEQEESYYTFCYFNIDEQSLSEVEKLYRENGDYPVWIHEWADKISKEEYEKLVPKTSPVKLPEGEKISSVTLPDDYVPSFESEKNIYDDYYEIVSNADSSKWDGFQLLDLDGDGMPELFATCIDGERVDPGMQPYMIVGHYGNDIFINDELADGAAGAGGYRGQLYCLKGVGMLHDSAVYAPLGEPSDTVYVLDQGKIKYKVSGSFEADTDSAPDGDDWDLFEHGSWKWDGLTVTEDEYKKKLREATDNTMGFPMCEIDYMDKESMLEVLREGNPVGF